MYQRHKRLTLEPRAGWGVELRMADSLSVTSSQPSGPATPLDLGFCMPGFRPPGWCWAVASTTEKHPSASGPTRFKPTLSKGPLQRSLLFDGKKGV